MYWFNLIYVQDDESDSESDESLINHIEKRGSQINQIEDDSDENDDFFVPNKQTKVLLIIFISLYI